MNFCRLRQSAFMFLGHSRFDYSEGYKFVQRDTVFFETTLVKRFSQAEFDRFDESTYRAGKFANSLELLHLRKALHINDPNFLDFEFKKEITRQWLEVSSIIDNLDQQPKFSMLLINEPGLVIPKHRHGRKQTLTFCYKFDDDKSNVFEDSCFIVGEDDNERKINFTDDNKFFFTFLDDLPHEVRSNEWRFFWFHDYDEYVTLPKESDIGFTYLPI